MSTAEKRAISLLREQVQTAHQLLEATFGDVTPEEAHWSPPGKASPLGANYAHVVISEDATMNGLLKGGLPMFASSWSGKVGVSELPPMPNPNAPGFPDWSEWGRRVKVDLPALRKYAQAVYAASDDYLASLTDSDLNRPVNLSPLGLGESTVGYVLNNGILGNALSHTGEISCLKGLQGKRGYPF
ncbi:MAG: hypothetical protein GTO13_08835 [Proteobacteria bacterium]|nr:hypothetical protein [Pseudomonadota bacterium]